jgi:hypothetical protein
MSGFMTHSAANPDLGVGAFTPTAFLTWSRLNERVKKSPVQRSRPNRATGQILPQDIVSVLIVARKKGKGNEKKARVQDYLGHAP